MSGIKSLIACKIVKIRLFKTLTRTVLTYGCEACKLFLSQEKRRPYELFGKKYLKVNIWTGERARERVVCG